MADFFARISSGATSEVWADPPSATTDARSRLNPRANRPHTRWIIAVGVEAKLRASIDGLGDAPLDAALGGQLFRWAVLESPVPAAITWSGTRSAEAKFTAPVAGHYTIGVWRTGHGGVILHADAR